MTSTEVTEQRLRDALAQRADRTEPSDDALDRLVEAADAAPRRDRRRRSAGLLAAAAVLLAVVAVAVAVSRPGPERVDTTDEPLRTTTTSTTTEPEDPTPTTVSTTVPEATTTAPVPTTTTPPPTTTTPPTTTAPPPVLPGASTDPVNGPGTGAAAIAQLADVRVGSDEGFDRVVIELHDGHLPDWTVSYVEPPIRQDGSGETVRVAGEAFLLVTMTPASAYALDGETPVATYPGPDRIPGPGGQVVEVVQVGDYEAVATWAIGLRTGAPFRVTTLTAPARIVIDIATPAP